MVTLKAICGWDGWVILYTVTPRASLQSDANNSSLDSKEVTLYLHRGGLGNNWPGIGSPRILSSSSGRHHNRQPIVNSVYLGLTTRCSSSLFFLDITMLVNVAPYLPESSSLSPLLPSPDFNVRSSHN